MLSGDVRGASAIVVVGRGRGKGSVDDCSGGRSGISSSNGRGGGWSEVLCCRRMGREEDEEGDPGNNGRAQLPSS